jgi:hypothetical protein
MNSGRSNRAEEAASMWPHARILPGEWKRDVRRQSYHRRGVVFALLAILALPSVVLGACLGLRLSENQP